MSSEHVEFLRLEAERNRRRARAQPGTATQRVLLQEADQWDAAASELQRLEAWLGRIYLKAAAVSAYHRHGKRIPARRLDALANLLVDYEQDPELTKPNQGD